jgi:hypothetical protein
MNVDVYLLDWNQHRPRVSDADDLSEVVEAFLSGRYEYSFTINGLSGDDDVWAAEAAYMAQGNNLNTHKVRRDRQTMSSGDLAVVDGRVYVCASFGFERLELLDGHLASRIEQSWDRWTQEDQAATSAAERN